MPRVVAPIGSLPSAPPARGRPDAAADSTTATPSASHHRATTGVPRGPVTAVSCHAPGGAPAGRRHRRQDLGEALPAVGQRAPVAVPPGPPGAARHGGGHRGGAGGSLEGVGGEQGPAPGRGVVGHTVHGGRSE